MAISDYLNKLIQLKNDLVANLNAKNVTATEDEKFNTLVPKVLEMGSDATATAEDIASGKTAYIASGKVTGTKEETEQNVEFISNPTTYKKLGTQTFNNNTLYPCNHGISINFFIKSLKVPYGVTQIGESSFSSSCFPYLESITFPETVTSIPYQSFVSSPLKKITIPKSITIFSQDAFLNCYYLSDIYYTGTEEEWTKISKGEAWNRNMGSKVTGGTTIHYNYTG